MAKEKQNNYVILRLLKKKIGNIRAGGKLNMQYELLMRSKYLVSGLI
jgi:hypothetical protein